MTIGDVIKAYRAEHNISMDDFARRTGLSKAYISILERNVNPSTGKPAAPSLETIRSVALAVDADVNDLISVLDGDQKVTLLSKNADNIIPPGFILVPPMQRVPVVGRVACGLPITAEENREGYVDAPADRRVDFALICEGDSMVDVGIQDGDVVYIRKQPQVENGQIAAVRVNGEATIKRVYIHGDSMILQPENSDYAPVAYTISDLDDVAIEGLVVGHTHWYF